VEIEARVFRIFYLKPLKNDEVTLIINKGIDEANEINETKTTIEDKAKQLIVSLSEGYPHFIQQFAYLAFESDSDHNISKDDVMKGATDENGAFEQIGQKYFQEMYFDKINSDEYRSVLQVMAEQLDGWVTKEHIRSAVSLKASTLNKWGIHFAPPVLESSQALAHLSSFPVIGIGMQKSAESERFPDLLTSPIEVGLIVERP
jgi:hypothetical protein